MYIYREEMEAVGIEPTWENVESALVTMTCPHQIE